MRDQADFVAPVSNEASISALQPVPPDSQQALRDQISLNQLRQQTNESVSNSSASSMLNGFALDVPDKIAEARCFTGWATVYEPTGNRTAAGNEYTWTNGLQGVAIDLDNEELGDLGTPLTIRNLNNGATTTQRVRDFGSFGNPKIYQTPDGKPRLVDFTIEAAKQIGATDMTPVEVCRP